MADKTTAIKTKVAVDGEAEYKKACDGISTTLKTLGSEMQLATAQYKDNATSTEALKSKQTTLQKVLEEQKKKVSEAEKALATMKDTFDDTDPKVQKYQKELNSAKTAVINTERQLKQINGELTKHGINWGNVGKSVANGAKAFGKGVLALGAAAGTAASALAGCTISASNYADDILTMSANTHIATDDLQAYNYALNFIDGDINTLTGSMKKNTKSMANAASGNKKSAAAYKKLGVSVTDSNGELRDGQTVYWEAIDALGKIENTTERDALAMELFGKSGTDLNTIIDAGSEQFKAYQKEAQEMGVIMSGESLAALGAFKDKTDTLKAGMEGLKNTAALIALPFLDVLAGDGITILKDFTAGIQNANGDMGEMANVIGTTLSQGINLIATRLPEFVQMGVNMLTSLINGIVQSMPEITTAATNIITTLCTGLITLLPTIINGAMQLVLGLATGIGQALPTLIPSIVSVIMQIVQTLIDNIPMLIQAALQLITGLAQGLIAAIPVIVAQLPTIINSLITGLLESIPLIIQAGIDLLTALITSLPDIITTIVTAIPQIITGITTALTENLPIIIQAGIDLFNALITSLPEIITTLAGAIPQIITGITNAIIENFPLIMQAGIDLFGQIIGNLPTIIANLVAAIPQIITGIVGAFGTLGTEMLNIGANMLSGLWDGISGAAGALWEKVQGWASGLWDGIKNFFGIHSPSTKFAEIGGYCAEGMGEGFNTEMSNTDDVMTAAVASAGEVTAAQAIEAINQGIISNISALDGAITSIVEQVLAQFTSRSAQFTLVGVDIAKQIAEGMVKGATAIAQAVPQLVETLIVTFTANNERYVAEGVDIVKQMALGMVRGIPLLTQAVPMLVQPIITAFTANNGRFIAQGQEIDRNIASGMVGGVSALTAAVAQMIAPIVTAVNSFYNSFVSAGENCVRGIWAGFENMRGWLEDNVRGMMRDIVRTVEDEMDINSPSKVFSRIGAYMAEGLGVGFGKQMRSVERNIRAATAMIAPRATQAVRSESGERIPRSDAGAPTVNVTQNIYGNENNYAAQQREAAKQVKLIAREVFG